MVKKLVISLITLGFAGALYANTQLNLKIPLIYKPQFGIYTAQFNVGKQPPEKVELIVDTGSSSLVLVSDLNHCANCSPSMTKGAVNPDGLSKESSKQAVTLEYGSTLDKAEIYKVPIQVKKGAPYMTLQALVLERSSHPSSILGLLKHNLYEKTFAYTPFMQEMTEHIDHYQTLTLALCGENKESYFELGKRVPSSPMFTSQLQEKPEAFLT